MASNKKRKRNLPAVIHQDVTMSKQSSKYQPRKGRKGTISIAVPGSILSNVQNIELKTALAGQIARAAAIFCVDEIIVFNDEKQSRIKVHEDDDPNATLAFQLAYFECPPYLRKRLFQFSKVLQKVGTVPPLDIPHHLKVNEWCQYREGVSLGLSLNAPHHLKKKPKGSASVTTLVDVGFPIAVPGNIPEDSRVTIKFDTHDSPEDFPWSENATAIGPDSDYVATGEAVDPSSPRVDGGYYWGYSVRRAENISTVFTECPFEEGYDISIGASQDGQSIQELLSSNQDKLPEAVGHLLIVLGGSNGLESAVEADEELKQKGIGRDNIADLFDFYVNVCPGQGTRTIRTEESFLIILTQLSQWCLKAIQ